MTVRVFTDSTASIPLADRDALGIGVAPLFVIEDGVAVPDDEVDEADFYQRLAKLDHLPGTAQSSLETLTELFRDAVAEGCEVLGIFITELMSGTMQAARLAADAVRAESPDAVIEVMDSRSNSMQEGFAVLSAARRAQTGGTLAECMDAARETMLRTRYLFTPASLEYLRRGGRIGAASAMLGNLLQIRPVLTVEHGVTDQFARVRTQAKALAMMAETFSADVAEKGLQRVVVHYIADRPTAEAFARERIEPAAGAPVQVIPVSASIGVHVGPAVGVVYETVEPLRDEA